jgi:hypothetical protein
MFGDGLEGLGAVEMLAAGDEPDFGRFEVDHWVNFYFLFGSV